MTGENRNLLLAVLLSAIVLFGWTFVADKWLAPAAPPVVASAPAAPGATVGDVPVATPTASVPAAVPVAKAIAAAPRIRIETPRLRGSINLAGARIDDLVLLDHRVSIAADSPPIRLFAPSGAKDSWFAGFGWTGAGAPPADAVWQASSGVLTPEKPVTLRWVSPDKRIFEQTIAVDQNFVFTVTKKLTNGSAAPVSDSASAIRSPAP